jgi:glycosyltransferase involved in cell wall biosynthesis
MNNLLINNNIIERGEILDKKISIIMPVYNGEIYIEESINSILQQSYSNFELIIVNDGSTDRTKEVINKFFYDLRIKYYEFHENRGKVSALNKGYQLTTGDFIVFLGADDVLTDNSLEKRLCNISEDTTAAFCNMWMCDKDLNPIQKFYGEKKRTLIWEFNYEELLFTNLVSGGTIMIRRDISDKIFPIPESLKFEDWWITFWTLYFSKRIIYQNEPLVYYRIHGKNDNGSLSDIDFDKLKKEDYKRHMVFYDELSLKIKNMNFENGIDYINIINDNKQIKLKIIEGKLFFSKRFIKMYGIKSYTIQNLISKNLFGLILLIRKKVKIHINRITIKQIVSKNGGYIILWKLKNH